MLRLLKHNPSVIAAIVIFSFMFMLFLYPRETVFASMRGIVIWWDVLFPSLLPFLVLAELMLGFGVVHFFGALLDPLMRPLFRVPGIGGFVMTMGFASGYPMAAKLTAQLWEQKLINREEGERLVAFSTTSDPIFLIGAVSVGFFHQPELAVILACAHYGSALLVGLLMRFHGKREMSQSAVQTGQGGLINRSFTAMHAARLKDGRPFGLMLQQAIQTSIQLIFVIGGLVVFASTILEVLSISGILEACRSAAGTVLQSIGFPGRLAASLVDGAFEVTLGAKAAGGAAGIPLVYKAAAGAFILSWAGLSVHAQIISLLHRTNLRYWPFLTARLLHSALSSAAVILLWRFIPLQEAAATMAGWSAKLSPETMIRFWSVPGSGTVWLLLTGIALFLSVLGALGLALNKHIGK